MKQITAMQAKLSQHFAKLVQNNQLAHAYLFSGASGSGKLQLAIWIAQAVFCKNPQPDGQPCLQCLECKRIAANEHPDVVQIFPDGNSIKVDQIRYLKMEFSKSGLESNRKIFIIKDVEKMTTSAANSLLKFIEEPPGNVTAFLLSSYANQILPTIISRCQVVELATNRQARLDELIAAQIDPSMASILVNLNAPLTELKELGNDEHFQKEVTEVWNWMHAILENDWRSFVFVQTRLMNYATDKKSQERLLELIVLLCRDIMLIKYQQDEEIAFIAYQDQLVALLTQLTTVQVTQAIELVLNCWKQLSVNVSFQNILETLTLKLCDVYHNR